MLLVNIHQLTHYKVHVHEPKLFRHSHKLSVRTITDVPIHFIS